MTLSCKDIFKKIGSMIMPQKTEKAEAKKEAAVPPKK